MFGRVGEGTQIWAKREKEKGSWFEYELTFWTVFVLSFFYNENRRSSGAGEKVIHPGMLADLLMEGLVMRGFALTG